MMSFEENKTDIKIFMLKYKVLGNGDYCNEFDIISYKLILVTSRSTVY